jgi:hypothetical protein
MQIIPSRIQRMANERPMTLLSFVGIGALAYYFYRKGSLGSVVNTVKGMLPGSVSNESTLGSSSPRSSMGSSYIANRNTGAGVSENRASGAV